MASIIVISGESEGDYYPLGQRTTVFGRAESVPAQILDERVSRRHLQIRYEPANGRYYALDMNSRHGTYINGRKVTGDCVLEEHDGIQIGGTKLLFTAQDFPDRESAMLHYKRVGERGRTTLPGD